MIGAGTRFSECRGHGHGAFHRENVLACRRRFLRLGLVALGELITSSTGMAVIEDALDIIRATVCGQHLFRCANGGLRIKRAAAAVLRSGAGQNPRPTHRCNLAV
jgi:hypothetical protein